MSMDPLNGQTGNPTLKLDIKVGIGEFLEHVLNTKLALGAVMDSWVVIVTAWYRAGLRSLGKTYN
jgi:hypothetical protein